MLPKWHILFGIIFSVLLFFVWPKIGISGMLIIFLSSVLIDFDHYAYYVFKKKDFSLKHAYIWYVEMDKKFLKLNKKTRKKYYYAFCFFHGFESLLILFILSIFYFPFLFILLGFLFHLIIDAVHTLYKAKKDIFCLISFSYYLLNKKNMIELK